MNYKFVLFSFFMVIGVGSCVYAGNKKPAGSKWKQNLTHYQNACDYDTNRKEKQPWSKQEARTGKEGSSRKPKNQLGDHRSAN